jgi:hypothetical protein
MHCQFVQLLGYPPDEGERLPCSHAQSWPREESDLNLGPLLSRQPCWTMTPEG